MAVRGKRCRGYKLLGEKGSQTGSPIKLLSDEQVLECRTLAEFHGWDIGRLTRRYGVSLQYMRQLLGYLTRSKLIPQPHRYVAR